MVDRIFAGVLLVVAMAYAFIAFTVIRAPFQYDPLGPETWPQILSLLAIACLLLILWRPGIVKIGVSQKAWFRLAITVMMLSAYAELYERLGFIISTIVFGAALCAMLGAGMIRALVFGVLAGVAGYLLCAVVLDLNLPEGKWVEFVISTFSSEGAS